MMCKSECWGDQCQRLDGHEGNHTGKQYVWPADQDCHECIRLRAELARLRYVIKDAQSIEWGDPTYFSDVFNILRKAEAAKEGQK